MHVRSVDGEERVPPLELFFDLVFVFAITQSPASSQPTRPGKDCCAGRFCLPRCGGCRGTYAWLTNTVDPEEGGSTSDSGR